MEDTRVLDLEDEWQILLSFLPDGWQHKAKELGAFQRSRKLATPEDMLRILLIHFAEGCSLRETVTRAKLANIASLSDVALLKRIKVSGDWLHWIVDALRERWFGGDVCNISDFHYNFRIVDGTTVQEPGATGSTWRIHYALQLHSLHCDEVIVTQPNVAESLNIFQIKENDVIIGDRGFARRQGIEHVVANNANVIIRINLNLPLLDLQKESFNCLQQLRKLQYSEIGDWNVLLQTKNMLIPARVCAVKKSKEATETSRKKLLRHASKNGNKTKPETLEMAGYFVVLTTLSSDFAALKVLEIYRKRWQVEIVFKRLKSIIGVGHLKKTEMEGAKAWIHGKLLVALLIEVMIAASDRFSPWGYFFPKSLSTE